MSLITGTSEQIVITPRALDRVKALLEKEGKPDAGLRLYISGGGCAGMSYGMSIDEAIGSDDAVVKSGGMAAPGWARARAGAPPCVAQAARTCRARGPLSLVSTEKLTRSPTARLSKLSEGSRPLRWKKYSTPSSAVMNPKPRSDTTFLTLPVMLASPVLLGSLGRIASVREGGTTTSDRRTRWTAGNRVQLRAGPPRRQEDRDLAGRPGLVLRIGRIGGDRSLPPLGALAAAQLADLGVVRLRAVLDQHLVGMGGQVVVPAWVLGSTSLGGDDRVLPAVLDAHHRDLADAAAAPAPHGDDDHRHAGVPERVGAAAARALVLLDLLAHPCGRARLVVTIERHPPKSIARRGGPMGQQAARRPSPPVRQPEAALTEWRRAHPPAVDKGSVVWLPRSTTCQPRAGPHRSSAWSRETWGSASTMSCTAARPIRTTWAPSGGRQPGGRDLQSAERRPPRLRCRLRGAPRSPRPRRAGEAPSAGPTAPRPRAPARPPGRRWRCRAGWWPDAPPRGPRSWCPPGRCHCCFRGLRSASARRRT